MAKKILACNILVSVMLIMALTTERSVEAVACEDFIPFMFPCLPYLFGSGESKPGDQCCSAATMLNKMAYTTQIRRDMCNCFKKSAESSEIVGARAKMIPQICKTPIPIDPTLDCKKIS